MRIGHGYDVHRLTPGRKCIIGGVDIPHDTGLDGHSDADVLTHAVMDALLGALALGDIGKHFPDTDPRYAGADSIALLRHVAALVHEQGYRLGNLDGLYRPKAGHCSALCLPAGGVLIPYTCKNGFGTHSKAVRLSKYIVFRTASRSKPGFRSGLLLSARVFKIHLPAV